MRIGNNFHSARDWRRKLIWGHCRSSLSCLVALPEEENQLSSPLCVAALAPPAQGTAGRDCLGAGGGALSTLLPSWDPAGGRKIAGGQVQQAVSSSTSHPKRRWLEALQVIDKRSHYVNNQEVCSVISCLF